MDLKEKLVQHFQSALSTPFLFVGSGFSRRYLGLEDWEALLRKFCAGLKSFEYYLATSNGDLSEAAHLIALDFHERWWSSPEYEASREKNKAKVRDKTSALRIEISNYLTSLSLADLMATEHRDELEILSRLNVDGIITTNWDPLLEKLFPDYKVYVGQSELLFSNPQSIAEIYKIHGSASRPATLVLTKSDYDEFDRRNPYLAAKLITLFVEHPIVFIGYSLTDKNICSLLKSIVSALGAENIPKLQNNLIFVQRAPKDSEGTYSQTYMAIDGGQIPITIVASHSFVPIYQALDEVKRKIPARVLRLCKEQLYELVRSHTPEKKLRVVDVDKIDKKDDLQFVVGVGVGELAENASTVGYQGIALVDLFRDVLKPDIRFAPEKILESTVPALGKSATYIPVFKYLQGCGIDSQAKYVEAGLNLSKHVGTSPAWYTSSDATYAKAFLRSEKNKTVEEIIATNTPEKAALFLAYVPREKFNLDLVQQFLMQHQDKFGTTSSYATYFRKLACLYDRYRHGWEFEPAKQAGRAKKAK